jgi:hypothetical protein
MQRFYAATFGAILNNLIFFIATEPLAVEGDPAFKENAARTLTEIIQEAEKIGLRKIVRQATRIRDKKIANSTHDQKFALMMELRDCLMDELAEYLFLSVGPTFKWYYLKPEKQVDPSVLAAFPSAARDVECAGKCIALDQGDAVVFHSMRILERGLNALAKRFDVSFNNTNWQQIIDQVEKEIRAISSKTNGPQWKEEEKFYSEAAMTLRWLKNAWRNYCMHVYETYEPREAGDIFYHTRTFMAHLATKLHE